MAEVKWIKIATEVFDNRKIKQIEVMPEGDSILVIWFKLLCLAGNINDKGLIYFTKEVPYTEEMLATQFSRPLMTVKLALETFRRFGMIEVIDNLLYVSSWEKYQNIEGMEKIKEQTKKRVAKHRQKVKELSEGSVTSNVTVTQSNATDIERDIDKDIDKEKETTITNSDGDFNIFKYAQERGFVFLSPINIQNIQADIEIYTLEEVKKAIDIADENGVHKYSYVKAILERRRAGVNEKVTKEAEFEKAKQAFLEDDNI